MEQIAWEQAMSELARRLVACEDFDVSTAGQRVGYEDMSHFQPRPAVELDDADRR